MLSIPSESLRYFLSISTNPYSALISGFIAFSFLCCLLFRVIQAQKNRNIFKKLSWQGNEIEIFEESDESYFDKYLNEVLYLFENLDADVIVFEDLDRHEADKIFERLREVNTLVNLKRKNKKKRVLRFFYLLRDDIFDSKDRTKFFDFIIPVVPVVDSSNSYNQFISHLNRNNLFEKFDKNFLQGVSLYVDDMRMLKNVCNEFLVYYSRLNTIELCLNKMLAMIVYKNLFPRDFSELQLGRGFVYAVFSNKENFISGRVKSIQEKLEKKKDEITALNSETLETIQELEYIKEKERQVYLREHITIISKGKPH